MQHNMQTLEEFRQQLLKPKSGRKKVEVTGSVGVYDMYVLLRKNNWLDIGKTVKEKEFYAIIRGINKRLANEVSNGKSIVFPASMGKLELRKQERGVSIVDGKLKVNYPINWKETHKLWYEDPEAMRNKILMRYEIPYFYRVKYDVFNATYDNKGFYQFKVNTFIKRDLSKNIREGKVDTAWIT